MFWGLHFKYEQHKQASLKCAKGEMKKVDQALIKFPGSYL